MTADQRAWLVIIGFILWGAVIYGGTVIGDKRLATLAAATNIVFLLSATLLVLTSTITLWRRWSAGQVLFNFHQPSYHKYFWQLLWGVVSLEVLLIYNYSLLIFCFSNVLFHMVRMETA